MDTVAWMFIDLHTPRISMDGGFSDYHKAEARENKIQEAISVVLWMNILKRL